MLQEAAAKETPHRALYDRPLVTPGFLMPLRVFLDEGWKMIAEDLEEGALPRPAGTIDLGGLGEQASRQGEAHAQEAMHPEGQTPDL